ncbi:MAG: hypothetical protein KAJ54_02370 [Candidatus Aenigmarchaeota archaeon]|nr:hypothetical protein [Candidatus Aenigmarchaeota archaeon]MCK5322415.1 hypothetical protein [Candidatus Aenigmarchaeota archaeon]
MRKIPETRLFAMWVSGSIALMCGVWIAGQVEMVSGATTSSYFFALLISIVFNMIGAYAIFDMIKCVAGNL